MNLAPVLSAGMKHNRPNMKNNNLIRFVQSLVILPVMTMPLSLPDINNNQAYSQIPQNVLVKKVNIEGVQSSIISLALSQAVDDTKAKESEALEIKAQTLKARADFIDAYFKARNMPLLGTGMKMAIEADKNELDWRLLPAIAVRESTGGKFDCKKVENNPFGWGSCKISFKSIEAAIETVAKNLGGNNPKTAKHYDNKTVTQILRAYNPPSVVLRYAEQVIAIMNAIGDEEIALDTPFDITQGKPVSSSDLLAQKG